MRLCFGAAILLLLASTAPAQTLPATQNALLREGIGAYDELDYEQSIRKLSAALLRVGNTSEDNLEIYTYLGLSYLLLERPEEATGAFRNLLALAPDYRFDAATAPRIVEFFESVRARWEADGRPGVQALAPPPTHPVRVMHVAPNQAAAGRPLRLIVRLHDPDDLGRGLFLSYRSGARGAFVRVLVPARSPSIVATVPARAVRPGTVEYFLEVVDGAGASIATRGDAEAPVRVVIPGDEQRSVLGTWWFWAGTAALVGGGVALAAVLASGGRPGRTTDTTATVRIDISEAEE